MKTENKCDRCGKDTHTDDKSKRIIGIEFLLKSEYPQTKEYEKYMKKQIGKYELNRKYQICWECMLDTFIGKERHED